MDEDRAVQGGLAELDLGGSVARSRESRIVLRLA